MTPMRKSGERPFVSVVIATRNRARLLALALAALCRQQWPADRFEIIVIDNGSTDTTPDVVAQAQREPGAPAIRFVYLKPPGKSRAVNAGLALARGSIVALTDDDAQAEPLWIDRLAAAVTEEGGADFVAGRITPIWQTPPPPWMSPALYGALGIPDNGPRRGPLSASGSVMPIGANAAVTRRALQRVGGLCETLGKLEGTLQTGEDHEFFLRLLAAGCRGIYEPSAVVRHLVSEDRLQRAYFVRWLHQNGRDVARLQQHHPPPAHKLAGVPRYLWREAATDVYRMVRAAVARDRALQFASAVRLAWFGGYLRETARARVPLARTGRVPVTAR
jgi:glycosyltransferase involved in cell wall biosynthesis